MYVVKARGFYPQLLRGLSIAAARLIHRCCVGVVKARGFRVIFWAYDVPIPPR